MAIVTPVRATCYPFQTLADRGVRDVFKVFVDGAMYIMGMNDFLGRESRVACVCNHHEQSCAPRLLPQACRTSRTRPLNDYEKAVTPLPDLCK